MWHFVEEIGPRRTQSLAGGLLATAPYHWSGDRPDIEAIIESTYVPRMGGGPVASDGVAAMSAWLDALPAAPGVVTDADAVARGRALLESRRPHARHGDTSLSAGLALALEDQRQLRRTLRCCLGIVRRSQRSRHAERRRRSHRARLDTLGRVATSLRHAGKNDSATAPPSSLC